MSIDRCHSCSNFVDTDQDDCCYEAIQEDGTVKKLAHCLCPVCREAA